MRQIAFFKYLISNFGNGGRVKVLKLFNVIHNTLLVRFDRSKNEKVLKVSIRLNFGIATWTSIEDETFEQLNELVG